MKRFTLIVAMVLMMAMPGWAQAYGYGKITPDLIEEMNSSSKSSEMFQTIIVLSDQFDAKKTTRQLQHLNKTEQRQFVMGELQQISQKSQMEILEELQQGQKAVLVDNIHSFWIVNAISCTMTKDMVIAISERPDVKYVMKDTEVYITDGEEADSTPLDQDNNQWNVTQVNADDVWEMGYTGAGVIVAVIDTGVNYNHTDIVNNMWDGGTEYPHHGWDFVNNDNDPMDDNSHGTHCAGTVSSYGTNGKQCGIAKDAKIMALKVLNAEGKGSNFNITTAVEFAVSHGADILSLSLGGNDGGSWIYRIVFENVMHCGVIAAVSAGNEGDNLSEFPVPFNVGAPGNCPSPWRHPDQTLDGGHSAVVAVGATTSTDTHSYFSSIGPSTWATGENIGFYDDYPWDNENQANIGLIKPDISAPGSGIYSLNYASNNGYSSKSGTSMAAPCVAGVMALMLQANPTLTPVEIDSIIETTAVACGGQTSKNNTFGSGRIDALAAINYMLNACTAPTNLVATLNEAEVVLDWDAAENVTSYRVYRNSMMIANAVAENTYTDTNAPTGYNTYYVRSNGENNQASIPSNQVAVNITTNVTINVPSNIEATYINTNEDAVTLAWDAPAPRTETLCYVTSRSSYSGTGSEFTAAQKYPSSMLQPYAGMQIEHIYFSLKSSGSTCTINLYEGDEMMPGTSIFEGSFTSTEATQLVDYTLSHPIAINPNKDLWITITTSDKVALDDYDEENGNTLLFKYSEHGIWFINYGIAWSFQLGLSDMDYTYNVYRNDVAISSNQDETSYTDSYTNGMNKYQVTAVTNSYESPRSNTIMLVNNSAILDDLTINVNDKLFVLPNSSLTVDGTLTNTNPDNLILEDGAQLINSSTDVNATVKKDITAFTTGENDGWNLIASPFTGNITPNNENGLTLGNFDLYRFNQSAQPDNQGNALEWENWKKQSSDHYQFSLKNGEGYLYSNNNDQSLVFQGTLTANATPTALDYDVNATLKGFNLIGNPYPCNAYTTQPFYVLQYNSNEDRTKFVLGSGAIPPCAAIMVQAQGTDETVAFSKTALRNQPNVTVSVAKADMRGNAIIDKARIGFDPSYRLAKFDFSEGTSQLYIPQNGQEFAVAYANEETEMPLNFTAAQNGTYTLSFETEDLELNYLHLIDNLTGNDVDLLATPTYTFEANTSDYTTRFRLLFAPVCEDTNDDNAAFAFISDGDIIVNDAGEASLQIVDMMGRVVVEEDATNRISISEMAPGVYVLRLIDGEKVKTQKIVIE